MPRRGVHGSNTGLLFLATTMFQFGVDRILPVTLLTIAANVYLFLYSPFTIREVCISASSVFYMKDYRRIALSALHHLSDMHLYYNMASFLVKGNFLERRFKSVYFGYLLVVFTGLCGVSYIAVSIAYARLVEDKSQLSTCAAGFSGVIFALKVLCTHYTPEGQHTLFGIVPLPSKYVVWAELVVIQYLVPGTSFVGHLSGILVGLAYLHTPIKSIMDAIIPPADTWRQQHHQYRPQQYTPQPPPPGSRLGGTGTSGYGRGDTDDLAQSRRTHLNHHDGDVFYVDQPQYYDY